MHVGFGFGLVAPVVEGVAYRHGERGRHVDQNVPRVVFASCFNNEDFVAGLGRQAVG